MPEWITQLLALVALLGIVSLCFWKARGVKPSRGKRDDIETHFAHKDF
jgi:hypothetical protein